jgi:hypothetical protein
VISLWFVWSRCPGRSLMERLALLGFPLASLV